MAILNTGLQGQLSGKAMWAHLATPDTYQGENLHTFSLILEPSEQELDKFEKHATEVWAEYSQLPEVKGRRLKGEPHLGIRESDEGGFTIKFKCKDTWKLRDGTTRPRIVPIFDGMGNIATKQLREVIGNGSDVIVSYSLYPYCVSSTNYGVSVQLQAVQVLKLVRYGKGESAQDFGFTAHKGTYDYKTDTVNADMIEEEDEIPFVESSSELTAKKGSDF